MNLLVGKQNGEVRYPYAVDLGTNKIACQGCYV